ncbi:aminotransferase class I/II-fold pyridoxal phosphate-dependent enzyme [Haloplasma contractile]|uniref:Lysine decarboxylase protein n=1 Tax=Haloplasma contractile SSD-17B TaxID=1033810 RepID=U2FHM6_9MOLU|nr:aminotransferase class I/II-fold pyridoxal phosphate-dependent enzyme [Haloplasma contractile]ERJ12335.1 Lysine decarboxylase protein [Haloplasma contractile SSD-17B]
MKYDQTQTPIYTALKAFRDRNVVPFDVPGHKHGRGNRELTEFLGEDVMRIDVNSMKPLDNACHPTSVIKEAELLMADAFGADYAYFMVNGTTSAVQAMIMSVCKSGDKIIMPRNVHKSAINSLILSGATPVYIDPGINEKLGISLGMSVDNVKEAIKNNPDAKAIFVINPTYYGICSNLKEIINLAHKHDMYVLADEAHGTHFYFTEETPSGAIHLGADMAALSLHKTGGSLTQSSALLINSERLDTDFVRSIINLTQTTSSSYLLLSSLDITRKMLAIDGEEIISRVCELSKYAREKVNAIGDYYAFGEEMINNDTVHNYDITKLSINTVEIGLAGFEVYDLLRDEYNIQIEFGDANNILAIISVGDTYENIDRLVQALKDIKEKYKKDSTLNLRAEFIAPTVVKSPRAAFYADKEMLRIEDSVGHISGEFVMCYPPGIPILSPGEKISEEALDYILYAKKMGSMLTGTEDREVNHIKVLLND